jgi:hypothetical protein
MSPEDEGYAIQVACTNCDYTGSVTLSKGLPFRGRGFVHATCPYCGCRTLAKQSDERATL